MSKLLVFQLAVQSSYADNIEREAEEDRFDTIQWWFTEAETWRIKTFAIDQDIHTHCIAGCVAEEVAIENTVKHYADVVEKAFVLQFDDLSDASEVAEVMADIGGASALEVARNGKSFAFWNPARLKFVSKSQPK